MTEVKAGIEVGKDRLDVHANDESEGFENGREGFRALHGWLRERGVNQVMVEANGRFHHRLHQSLHDRGYTVHIVDPLQVRRFAEELPTAQPKPEGLQELEDLLAARETLVDACATLAVHLQKIRDPNATKSLTATLTSVEERIREIDVRIAAATDANPELAQRLTSS